MKRALAIVFMSVLGTLLGGLTLPASGQTLKSPNPLDLQFNKKIERQLGTGESNEYRFSLRQGQAVSVEVEELDANLQVELIQLADSKTLVTSDIGGGFERESLTFISDRNDNYLIRIKETESESGFARYRLKAKRIDNPPAKENSRINAERLMREAVADLKGGTPAMFREALRKHQQALILWQKVGDEYWEGQARKKIGETHYSLLEFLHALNELEKSLSIARELGDKKFEAVILNWIGLVRAATGDRKSADDNFQRSLGLLKDLNSPLGQAYLLHWLGDSANQRGDKQKAIDYFNQALPLARLQQNRGAEAGLFMQLGIVADSQKQTQQALDWYNKALPLYRSVSNKFGEGWALQHLGTTYSAQGDPKTALEYFDKALTLFRTVKNRSQEGLTLSALTGAYRNLGDIVGIEKTVEGLKRIDEFYRDLGFSLGEIIQLNSISLQYNGIGKRVEAVKYAELCLAVKETVPEGTTDAQTKTYQLMMGQSKVMSLQTIGMVHYNSGNRDKALSYLNQALTAAEKENDKISKSTARQVLGIIGQIYGDQYDWTRALDYYNRALANAREIDDKASIVQTLNSIGLIYTRSGSRSEALKSYEQSLDQIEKLSNRTHIDQSLEASILDNIGDVHMALGNPQKSLEYHNRALAMFEKMNDPYFVDQESTTYSKLATVYSYLGEKRKALELLNKAISVFQRAPSFIKSLARNRTTEAHLINQKGLTYADLGENQRALDLYNQALKAATDAEDRDLQSTSLNNIALVYSRLGEPRKALQFLNQALEVGLLTKSRERQAITLNNLGAIYSDLDDNQTALKKYNEALDIAKEFDNKDAQATTLNNIGSLYLFLGQNERVLDLFNQALNIQQKIGDKAGQMSSLSGIGIYYSNIGERGKAFECFSQLLSLARTIGDKSREAATLRSIAYDDTEMGENQEALNNHLQSLTLTRETGERYGQMSSLFGIASVHRAIGEREKSRGQFIEALETFQQALKISVEIEDNATRATILSGIGRTYIETGDFDKASQNLTAALQLAQKYQMKTLESVLHIAFGKLSEKRGNPTKAIDEYQQALVMALIISDRDSEAKAYRGLMSAWAARHYDGLAIYYGKRAINRYQELRSAIQSLRKQTQEFYQTKITDAYRELADLLIASGRLPEAEEVLDMLKQEEFFQFVRRDPVYSTLAARSTFNRREGVVSKQHEASYQALANEVARLGKERDDLLEKVERTPEDEQQLSKLDAQLGIAKEHFLAVLKEVSTGLGNTKQGARVADIENALALSGTLRELGPGTVALYTLVGKQTYRIMLITSDTQQAYEQPIREADLNSKIQAFRETLQKPGSDPKPQAQELFNLLIGPKLARDLEQAGAKTLMWSLDGTLRYLPVAALYDGKQYLVERYRNVMLTSMGVDKLKDPVSPQWRALGLGVSKAHPGFDELKGVPRELRGIIVDESSSSTPEGVLRGRILLDENFTKQTMMVALRQRFSVIHIASHFKFQPGNETDSYLLVGDNKDDHLTLAELKRWPNAFERIELLTLSACETAMSSTQSDGEEVDSLGSLAQLQGAKAVIATLWNVEDQSTQILMRDFYGIREAHQGMPKAEALRQAQVALLKGARYNHPYYWAPFILIGNWK
jgi:CHAT domain-containing protein/Tfp pilus assembly protein PilF